MKVVSTDYTGQETEHDIGSVGLNVIVHDQGIAVEAPGTATITPEDTVDCIRNMSQEAWEHISTGSIFRSAWKEIFSDSRHAGKLRDHIPANIQHFQKMDIGVRHIAGLIIGILTETMIKGNKKVFIVQPETYLHPSEARCLVCLINFLRTIPPAKKLTKENAAQDYVRNDYESDKASAIQWLRMLPDDKRVGSLDGKPLTPAGVVPMVEANTKTGRAFVAQYVQLRDG